MMTPIRNVLSLLLCVSSFLSCDQSSEESAAKVSTSKKLAHVVATTGMVADLARELLPPTVQVHALMGPGIDPHLYKASYEDMRALEDAEIILYNGIGLEGKLAKSLEALSKKKECIALGSFVPKGDLRQLGDADNVVDPHIWFDLEIWKYALQGAEVVLQKQYPQHAAYIEEHAKTYREELHTLHLWALEKIALIPKEKRVLITAHDAFSYFGRRYGMEVIGLQGVSTATEFGVFDVERIVRLAIDRKIPAVFIESSVPPRFVEALVKGAESKGGNLRIGGELYSDALGDKNSPAGNFLGMFRANVETIVKALRE